MRKHIRGLLRRQGELRGVKPSRYVHEAWDALQRRRLGPGLRARNVGRGTRPKRRWLREELENAGNGEETEEEGGENK